MRLSPGAPVGGGGQQRKETDLVRHTVRTKEMAVATKEMAVATKEMVQPCPICLHATSLVPQRAGAQI